MKAQKFTIVVIFFEKPLTEHTMDLFNANLLS